MASSTAVVFGPLVVLISTAVLAVLFVGTSVKAALIGTALVDPVFAAGIKAVAKPWAIAAP